MVNNAMIQPVIPNVADKIPTSRDQKTDTQFKDVLDQTGSQKAKAEQKDPQGEALDTAVTNLASLASMLFIPDYLLSQAELPKVNDTGMTVAIENTDTAAKALSPAEQLLLQQSPEDVVSKPARTSDAEEIMGKAAEEKAEPQIKQVQSEPVLNGMDSSEVKEQEEPVKLQAENQTDVKPAKEKPVNAEEAVRTQTSQLDTKTDASVNRPSESAVQMEAIPYVKDNTQIQTNPNVAPKQTVSVDPGRPEEMMKSISDSMLKNIISGKQEFELQLEPLHLGKLAIKVTYEAGKTAVSIICTNAKTLEAMAHNAREIGNILDARLGTETAIVVDRADVDYLDQQSQQENNNQREQENNNRHNAKGNAKQDAEQVDFLQQLRLGLI